MLLPLSHVGGRFAGEEVFARRGEDVHDLGVLRKPRLVLDAARDDADVAGHARALLVAKPEVHPSRDHPEDLLVRVAMGGRVSPGLHRPPYDHFFLASEHTAGDLIGDLFFGQALQRVIALRESHRATSLPRRGAAEPTLITASTAVKDVAGAGSATNAIVSPAHDRPLRPATPVVDD